MPWSLNQVERRLETPLSDLTSGFETLWAKFPATANFINEVKVKCL